MLSGDFGGQCCLLGEIFRWLFANFIFKNGENGETHRKNRELLLRQKCFPNKMNIQEKKGTQSKMIWKHIWWECVIKYHRKSQINCVNMPRFFLLWIFILETFLDSKKAPYFMKVILVWSREFFWARLIFYWELFTRRNLCIVFWSENLITSETFFWGRESQNI